jgi:hypothetical protein
MVLYPKTAGKLRREWDLWASVSASGSAPRLQANSDEAHRMSNVSYR